MKHFSPAAEKEDSERVKILKEELTKFNLVKTAAEFYFEEKEEIPVVAKFLRENKDFTDLRFSWDEKIFFYSPLEALNNFRLIFSALNDSRNLTRIDFGKSPLNAPALRVINNFLKFHKNITSLGFAYDDADKEVKELVGEIDNSIGDNRFAFADFLNLVKMGSCDRVSYYFQDKNKEYVDVAISNNHEWGNPLKYSALHFAVEKGNIEMVRLLLDAGARTDVLNCYNKSPYDLALDLSKSGSDRLEIIDLIEQKQRQEEELRQKIIDGRTIEDPTSSPQGVEAIAAVVGKQAEEMTL